MATSKPGFATQGRVQPTVITTVALGLLAVAYVSRLGADQLESWDLAVVGCLTLGMFVGEFLRVGGPSGRGVAPVATSCAVALALASEVDGHALSYGAPVVVVTVTLTILVSAVWLEPRTQLRFRIAGHAIRVIVVALIALVFREMPVLEGASLNDAAAVDDLAPWQLAIILVGIVLVAQVVEMSLHVWLRTALGGRPWLTILREDRSEMWPIALASMSTGVVVALGLRSLHLVAIPLFLAPLVLMRFAIGRQRSATIARRQATAALSRLTDLAGYTTTGHAERVAGLCARVGDALHLPERSMVDLEAAALLHDVGQIALQHPVPDGATIGLAPLDQQQIADDGADLVERTGALDRAAEIIRIHPTSYRVLREEGRPLPLPARVLKICNAYDDLTRGDAARRDPALERILLGLGYEYDPEIVEVLQHVTQHAHSDRAHPAGGTARA